MVNKKKQKLRSVKEKAIGLEANFAEISQELERQKDLVKTLEEKFIESQRRI